MAGGLVGLLDDLAALAKAAAASIDDVGAAAGKASAKAAGVVVDDTAGTPAYVHGLAADRGTADHQTNRHRVCSQQAGVHPSRRSRLELGSPTPGRGDPDAGRRLPVLRGRPQGPPPAHAPAAPVTTPPLCLTLTSSRTPSPPITRSKPWRGRSAPTSSCRPESW